MRGEILQDSVRRRIGKAERRRKIGRRCDFDGEELAQRAPEGFWVAALVVVLVLASIVVRPVGRLDSPFIQALEVVLGVLWGFLVGRNVALLGRSRDAPQHDL